MEAAIDSVDAFFRSELLVWLRVEDLDSPGIVSLEKGKDGGSTTAKTSCREVGWG